jgi:hypothetical protein
VGCAAGSDCRQVMAELDDVVGLCVREQALKLSANAATVTHLRSTGLNTLLHGGQVSARNTPDQDNYNILTKRFE